MGLAERGIEPCFHESRCAEAGAVVQMECRERGRMELGAMKFTEAGGARE